MKGNVTAQKRKSKKKKKKRKKKEEEKNKKKRKTKQIKKATRHRVTDQGRRKKKHKGNLKKPMCICTWAFLTIKKFFYHYSVFLSFQRANILVGLSRKHISFTIYFSSFLSNQTHSKKVFISIFSQKFSIHHVLPPNKHTLTPILLATYLPVLRPSKLLQKC